MRTPPLSLVAAAATLALTVAACGSGDTNTTASSDARPAASGSDMKGMDMSGGGGDVAGMTKLAETDPSSDLDVGLFAMPPETFYVSEGDGRRGAGGIGGSLAPAGTLRRPGVA